jgi:hypothetical protein
MPLLVVAGTLLLIALWAVLDHRRKMALGGSPEFQAVMDDLSARVQELEAEREHLVRRIQTLEAIASGDPSHDPLASGDEIDHRASSRTRSRG